MSILLRLGWLGRLLGWLVGRPLLRAPSIPKFTLIPKGTTMQLAYQTPLADLPDPSYQYIVTVSPQGGTQLKKSFPAGATPVFTSLPDSPGTIGEYIVDAAGDVISGVSTKPYVFLAAPVIPQFTVSADPTPA